VGSASDWDAFFLDYRAGVGFWHSVAQPGKREESLRSRVDVWLDDEFGSSASSLRLSDHDQLPLAKRYSMGGSDPSRGGCR
jgi:hypothetical protein